LFLFSLYSEINYTYKVRNGRAIQYLFFFPAEAHKVNFKDIINQKGSDFSIIRNGTIGFDNIN
tara:strand:+ start:10674 stop:10862 length:189 start_codon:yes stop_codon:yes gene_type:complete